MRRITMILPRTVAEKNTDSKAILEEMGFTLVDDTSPSCYEVLAPDGWTIDWRGRDGAVFNQQGQAVIWLWKKSEPYDYVFTMRLKP